MKPEDLSVQPRHEAKSTVPQQSMYICIYGPGHELCACSGRMILPRLIKDLVAEVEGRVRPVVLHVGQGEDVYNMKRHKAISKSAIS